MPYTDAERKVVQTKMFGCLAEDIDAAVTGTITYRVDGNLTEARLEVAESMLSDAQEAMHFGDAEGARQTINRVKYLLRHYPRADFPQLFPQKLSKTGTSPVYYL